MTDYARHARDAYHAYGQSTGWLTHDGRQMPGWNDLGDAVQAAWTAAVTAVLPPLTVALTVYQAWWEDYANWDGQAMYLDADTAKEQAATDYVAEEYGDQDDPESARPGELTWGRVGSGWNLADSDRSTAVHVDPTPVYRRR
ncbi:hypothetical protein ABH930_000287 [Kitasatospora sp. GAS204A]|uniref:hypothetical protein n=1 Tax=unclassified Kitasatospora TaxID=2633591 RepID=UPI002475B9B1|nr:hypothetical protein [Kitasatospora sp. GAS204B]MDH6116868.1 hypothetical protein [Kitasatospora sp. GAS204B]